MKDPLVTVILPTYNQAPSLEAALRSALDQTHRNIEVILVDNGSSDGSAALIDRYMSDGRLRVHRYAENGPPTQRWQRAVDEARGEYVSFLFGDDIYLPEKTETQLRAFAGLDEAFGVVYGPHITLHEATGERRVSRGRGPSGWVAADFIMHYHSASLSSIAPLVRTSALRRVPFHTDLFLEGIENILLRLSLIVRFQYLGEPLAIAREHPGNNAKSVARNTRLTLTLLDRLAADPALPTALRPAVVTAKCVALQRLGWMQLRAGADARAARAAILEAIAIDPRYAVHPRTLIGLVLSFAPARLRSMLNRIASLALASRPKYSIP